MHIFWGLLAFRCMQSPCLYTWKFKSSNNSAVVLLMVILFHEKQIMSTTSCSFQTDLCHTFHFHVPKLVYTIISINFELKMSVVLNVSFCGEYCQYCVLIENSQHCNLIVRLLRGNIKLSLTFLSNKSMTCELWLETNDQSEISLLLKDLGLSNLSDI